jgi:hypothetical protein
VKLALLAELNNLKINSAILDKKDKGKSKAKTVQLAARINDTPNEYSSEALINRMQEMQPEVSLPDSELTPLMLLQCMEQEDSYKARGLNISAIRAYQARGFSCADYIEDDIARKNKEWKKQCEDDEIVSLGNEEPAYTMDICDEEHLYSNYNELPENSGDFYDRVDMTKYEHNLLTIQIAKFKDHTVSTMVEKANLKSLLNSCNSSIIDVAICNKTVFTVNKHVIISNFSKLSPHTETSKDVWIIDSGASVHITNKLSDFTSYKPYTEPEEVETANKHDNLTILGEGTVFFETESDNGQIHIMRLDNICYIPNGSNRLLSRGQLCLSGLVEHADSESTTFLLLTGHIFLRGYPRHSTDTLHWVQSKITHPNVPMAEPSVFILNYETWHLRMAHPSKDVLQHL